MLTRRHIRIKVMQVLYAVTQSKTHMTMLPEEMLEYSASCILGLYFSLKDLPQQLLSQAKKMLDADRKRYIETTHKVSSEKLLYNKFLKKILTPPQSKNFIKKYHLVNWSLESKYLKCLYDNIIESEYYRNYSSLDVSSFDKDKAFVIEMYCKVVAPNKKLMECVESHQITWIDDYPFINDLILKKMQKLEEEDFCDSTMPSIFKDKTDKEFAYQLLRKTIEESDNFETMVAKKAINWETKRIAKLDIVILKMALCESLYMDIPIKVIINEYVEIAKEYATPKSNIFINGILDNILKELVFSGVLKKQI